MKNYQIYFLKTTLCLVLSIATTGQIQASISTSTATIAGFANATGSNPPNSFQIVFSGLPTDSVAGGVLNLETFGDFNAPGEWIDISIDGISFGRLWDNNPSNDQFDGFTTDDDDGQQYGTSGTNAGATLQLTESQLDAFLADGSFVIGFDAFGPDVDNFSGQTEEFITATLEFDAADQSAIPEPTTFFVWSLLSVMGLCEMRRKKRS